MRYRRNESIRIKEIHQILSHFRPSIGIMAGDFNSNSHLDDYKADISRAGCCCLKSRIPSKTKFRPSHFIAAAGWRDTHASDPVTTWIPALSSPGASCAVERIDRIYVTPQFRVLQRATLGYRDFIGLRGWPMARDHRLVFSLISQK